MEEEEGADEGAATTTRSVCTPVSVRANGSQTCSATLLNESRKAPSTAFFSSSVKRLASPENCEAAKEANWLEPEERVGDLVSAPAGRPVGDADDDRV
jgi:hypothetical protein